MKKGINLNNKIKISFFSPASYPFFYPNSDAAHGGAELQMYLLAKEIAKNKKYNISFFVGNYSREKILKIHNIQLIKTIVLKQKDNIFSKLIKTVRYFFQLIKLNTDIIICTNANAFVGINAFYSKLFNKNFIYRTSHLIDVNKEYINNSGLSGKIYKYGLLRASLVITQNKEHQILLKNNYGINSIIIRNVIEIKNIKPKEKKIILWVGRFQKWKHPELFLKMANYFTEKQFVMICPYTNTQKNAWEELKEKANKIPNFNLIKKIPFNEIQTYFNKAVLFVNTSDYEGFPNTFLQAAQGKTPIVSLNVNPDNFITKYHCGIFANGDFNKMLSETKQLLKNKKEQELKAENLFYYLKEKHDIEKIAKEFQSVIETVL